MSMCNAIEIRFGGDPLVTLLVRKEETTSKSEILESYARWGGFDPNKLSGRWTRVIDITAAKDGYAARPYAQHEWPRYDDE